MLDSSLKRETFEILIHLGLSYLHCFLLMKQNIRGTVTQICTKLSLLQSHTLQIK